MTSHAYDSNNAGREGNDRRAVASGPWSNVTELASKRRSATLGSVTFVLGGRHYGTFGLSAPVRPGQRLTLYVVGERGPGSEIDCLVTDDPDLGTGEAGER